MGCQRLGSSVLWQLFQLLPRQIHETACPPLPADSKLSETRMLQFQWGAHQLANKIFADVVLQHYQDGDIVWVQVRMLHC